MASLKYGGTVQLVYAFAIFFANKTPARGKDTSRSDSKLTISDLLHGNFLVPDVIPVSPTEKIEVSYGDTQVEFGTILPFSNVENEPTHVSWPALKTSLYTLILYGPDIGAPDLLTRGWNHWLVVNIPGNRITGGDVHTKYNAVDRDLYRLEGLYRLLFAVYEQPNNESIPVPKVNIKARLPLPNLESTLFSINEFTKSHFFGTPIAANFFHVEGTDKIIED